jgi:hypothetical protein
LPQRPAQSYIGLSTHQEVCDMPIRISSLTRHIAHNGAMLHRAMLERIHLQGADHEPSEAEQALAEERRLLKEERAKRQERALQPRARAADRLVRTHHPEAKAEHKAKPAKEPKEHKAAAGGKAVHKPSRAEKHAAKAAAMDAARRAAKKSAKT